MAKLLDLQVFQEQYFPIKLLDGNTITLKKPSRRLLMRFLEAQNISKLNAEEQMNAIYKLVVDILNNNTTGTVFTVEDIQDYDIMILQAIIQGYTEFINEVLNNPNS